MFSNQTYPEYRRGYEDEVLELKPKKPDTRCQCGTDLPGTCPGVNQCPHAVNKGEEE
jgi:hypothetical protein